MILMLLLILYKINIVNNVNIQVTVYSVINKIYKRKQNCQKCKVSVTSRSVIVEFVSVIKML